MIKTILYLDHTATLGGGEIALLHLLQNLDRSRFTPVVLLFSHGPLGDKLRASGIETHVIPLAQSVVHTRKDQLTRGSLTRLRDGIRLFYYCRRLARFMRQRKVDLIHTNSLKADLIGAVAARLAGVPVVWHVRDRIADDYLPPKVAWGFRLMSRLLPHYIITNSAATLATLQLAAPSPDGTISSAKASVVHDGVNMLPLNGERPQSDPPLVGIVGRISPWKGQHIFIEAARLVRAEQPKVRFQIIGSALFGEAEYESEVRAQATAAGLDDCLEWTGFRTDVPELMASLAVLVHASTSGEPFGQVVAEGMMVGAPVVATNGGGVPEIVQEGVTGILVPMGDAPAMAAAITRLLQQPDMAKAMGEAGRQRVQEHFTIGLTARRVEQVYAQLEQRFSKAN